MLFQGTKEMKSIKDEMLRSLLKIRAKESRINYYYSWYITKGAKASDGKNSHFSSHVFHGNTSARFVALSAKTYHIKFLVKKNGKNQNEIN